MKPVPIQHVKHETIDEIENLPGPNKRKASPNRDPAGPPNSAEHGTEIKRQKIANNV